MKNHTGERISTNTYRAFLAAGTCLPLIRRSKRSGDQLYCIVETLGLGFLAAKVLKEVVPARRPDNGAPNSFPSSHSALAVSTAAVAGEVDREHAPWWYAGAGLICASRVLLLRHRLVDVAAGALLGWSLAKRVLASELGSSEGARREGQGRSEPAREPARRREEAKSVTKRPQRPAAPSPTG